MDNNQNNVNCNGDLNKSPLQLYIEEREREWTSRVAKLNEQLKTLQGILDMQGDLYNERQSCVDGYHQVLRMIAKKQQQYKPLYAQRYNFYKVNSQIRYNSDTAIMAQVQSDLKDYIFDLELINNHAKFMQETLKTIDNIIYSVKNRVDLEKLVRGYDL